MWQNISVMTLEEILATTPNLEVKDTGKYGRGVFAKEAIKKGETIYIFSGREIDGYECDNVLIPSGQLRNDDPLQIGIYKYIILNPLAYLFNHSCDPNSGMKGRSTLFAIRDIETGEEIVYDYSTTVGPDNPPEVWTMDCFCGSSKCRKKLMHALSLPEEVLQKYREDGALQDYILAEMRKAKNCY